MTLAALGRLALCVAVLGAALFGQGQGQARLYKDSRGELTRARAEGQRTISLVLATAPGGIGAAAGGIARLGGVIRARDTSVGYLRVEVPTDRVEAVVALPSLEAAEIDTMPQIMGYLRTWTEQGRKLAMAPAASASAATHADSSGWPPALSEYPFTHPYSPVADLEAADWRGRHPTWDGRGVTIADIEGIPDLFAPELQEAQTIDGRPVPKFADVLTSADPESPPGEQTVTARWLRMRDTVVARDGRFVFLGREYIAPHDGVFRIDRLNERDFCWFRAYHCDLNRDGNPPGADSLFAVLWDERSNTVWVDVGQDADFTNDQGMTDYAIRRDIGTFGKDDPATPLRESIGFVVQTDRRRQAVAVLVGIEDVHATMVQGAAAGSRGRGGHFDGVAPGARLVAIEPGVGHAHAVIEALIRAVTDPRIDVVVVEAVPTYRYHVSDGTSVSGRICDRLIARYHKPVLMPAGNATGLSAIEFTGEARTGLQVGAYQGSESYRVNLGVIARQHDNLHLVGAGGPASNGAIKPDLLAPSGVLSAGRRAVADTMAGLPGLYRLPPGYQIGNGTSTATPVAAGAIALLISAAKQAGIPYDYGRLRQALFAGARHLSTIPSYEQGHGLIQIASAWTELERLAGAPKPLVIESRAPVRTGESAWLSPPGVGPGLFEAEGWTAGQRAVREIFLTRTSGPAGPVPFTIQWVGNDGTFTSASEVALPFRQAVPLPVTIAPATTGSHSALLALVRQGDTSATLRVMCTIVASNVFTGPRYTLTIKDSVPRPGRQTTFLTVPPGVAALRLEFTSPPGRLVSFILVDPSKSRLALAPALSAPLWGVLDGSVAETVPFPEPGVWEISYVANNSPDVRMFDERRPTVPPASVPFTLTASLLGADVSAPVSGSDSAMLASAGPATASVRNRFASFTGSVPTTSIASGYHNRETLRAGAQQIHTVTVPEGSTALFANVRVVEGWAGDVDLYLFNCTSGTECTPIRAATGSRGRQKTVFVPRPNAGVWKLAVDVADIGRDSVVVDYTDLVLNPAYGSSVTPDPIRRHESGDIWTVPLAVWRNVAVPAPRRPYAFLSVDADNETDLAGTNGPIGWAAIPLIP